jgi:hypothetical protein
MPRKHEVHWIDEHGHAVAEYPSKPEAIAVAELLRRQGCERVRILVQIDPPQESGK